MKGVKFFRHVVDPRGDGDGEDKSLRSKKR
jgi:hypothetical protein